MSSGRNVHILCGSRDISLTCTDCGDETRGIDRDDLFIGGGPLDSELRGSLGNLFLLGFIVRAVLDFQLLRLTLFHHYIRRQSDGVDVNTASNQRQCHCCGGNDHRHDFLLHIQFSPSRRLVPRQHNCDRFSRLYAALDFVIDEAVSHWSPILLYICIIP